MKCNKNCWFQLFQMISILILVIILAMTQESLKIFKEGVTYLELLRVSNLVLFVGSFCTGLTFLQFGIMWYKLLSGNTDLTEEK